MTNQPKPQTFSQSIATRPLMGENPNNLSQQALNAKRREMLDNMYNQQMANRYGSGNEIVSGNGGTMGTRTPIPSNANGFQQIPQRPQIQPINNPQIVNPNMKAGKLNGSAFYDLGAMAGRNLIGTTAGGIGGYAYGGDMDSALAGALAGTLGQHGLYRGGKYLYNRMPLTGTDKALEKGYVNFSYEAIPSSHLDPKKYPLENEIYNTLSKDSGLSAKYENEVYRTKLFNDTAHKLGLKFKDMGQKAGYYTDNINGELVSVSNPSRQVQIKPEYDKNGNLTQAFQRKMEILSAVMGKGLKQDAVTWHIPTQIKPEYERNFLGFAKKDANGNKILTQKYKDELEKANGVRVNLGGKEINGDTLTKLDETLGKGNYGFIPDADGKSVRVIDFNGNPLNSDDIINLLNKNGYNIKVEQATPFDTHKMQKARDNGYMGNKEHYEPNWQYNQDYYDKLLKDGINDTNANIFRDTNIYPNIFGDARQIFKGETAERQWQDFIGKRQDTIRKTWGKLREKPIYSQTTIPNGNNKKGFITPNLAKGKALNGDAIDDIINKRTTQTPQSIQNRPLMGEMAERNAHLNQIREIFDKQNAKANLGKDYHSDINAVEQGLITPDEFINAWKKPSVADDIPHNGGGNGGDIPPNAPKGGGFADDGGNEFAKQIGLENLSDNDLKKAFVDMPKGD